MKRGDVARVFVALRERFASIYGDRMLGASLVIDSRTFSPGSPKSTRDVAWCEPRTMRVILLRRATRWNACRVVALLAHELGHLADGTVHRKGREKRADRLAARVLRVRIRYDGDEVQNLCTGQVTRPAHLHQ